ncbi:TPA: 6-carboxytetrahydropterin synthase [Pseudomonas aeruginosa]|uniref:6-pyruvoyl trahydropterin synthase family protein n=1 Tax=Pseudomonas TaxID=286 RepID=UPI000F53AC6E|nr:6-carboxytetrahydropterin synthase [Pseudomonas aeruginosa]MBG4032924.1 6-carboxytetrahydropterin synthase [Pseudomonas aeruginosa]MBG4436121.1 6-carboxytetrahydropterin synthase [Pseudomonas aeruginosa]MBG4678861.1 6-carboxytetrahydropterin synthase [Pseudomonas aeruginosa]MBG4948543.1 6-carboxytetrahydropterin synthase [Pseudomonas aeruginosa]MBH8680168.1 6-carboxytetrahydropterin synthase [Pseudomonas aeruginosa]
MSTLEATPNSHLPDAAAKAINDCVTVYELSQRFFFEAAHTLNRSIETEGSLRIHGHTYEAEVTVAGQPDAVSGMLVDLGYLRSEIARVREMLDHRFLDEVQGLGSATIENLCTFIRAQLEDSVPGLCAVMIERRASGDRCVLRWRR